MKGRRKKGIAAVFMAALMLIGLVPSDFTLVSAKAADKTYILNANNLTAGAEYGTGKGSSTLACGTDDYFTLNATDAEKTIKISANSKKFNVDGETISSTQRIQLQKNVANTIDFTVGAGKKATVTVCVLSSNSAAAASVALMDSDGKAVYGPKDAPGAYTEGESEVVFTDVEAGTYRLGTTDKSAKQANIYYVKVVEETSAPKTGTAPEISAATAALKADTEDTAVINWTVSKAATGDGQVAIDIIKDGDALKTVKIEDAATTSYEYKMEKSGSYEFKVYGICGSDSNKGITTSAVKYILELASPTVTAKSGDGKITLSWKEVKEADSYNVTIKYGNTVVATGSVTDLKNLTFVKEGLTNLKEYTCTVEAVRNNPAAKAMSDEVTCMPYEPVDTSSAIPGMTITDQTSDNSLSVSREAGVINVSQPATSSGISSSAITNSSFILSPDKLSGNVTMTADITITAVGSSTGSGVFFGAFTGTGENAKLASIALRGDKKFNAYRTKNEQDAAYNNGGSALNTAFNLGQKYTYKFSRTGNVITIAVGDETKSWDIKKDKDYSDFSEDLKGDVYLGMVLNNVLAKVENFKISKGDTTVFDSTKLTGSFSSFVDNWNMVSAPVISVSGNRDTMTVTSDCVIGSLGAGTVKVEMMNAAGEVVDTKSSSTMSNSQTFEFSPEESGDYTFTATASRPSVDSVKPSNTVSVKGFVSTLHEPKNVTATSQGSGAVKVEWDAYSEATDGYRVSYKAEGASDYTVAGTTKNTSYTVSGLTVGKKYDFKVEALRGSESAAATIAATATSDAKFKWEFSAYGSSTGSKNKYSGDANDGSVTVSAMGNAGKIVPNSTDGVSFYYTKIPTTSNFTLRAKVHVDKWTLSNGQEGYGLMVSDRVGANGDSTSLWNNQYQAIASKVEYYVDEETGEISDAGKKISMKIGLGVIAKTGVNKGNLDKFVASDTATINSQYKTETLPLDTSAMKLDAGTYNVIGNSTNTEVSDGLTALTDYYLTIQRNNTGYFVTYSDADGKEIKTQKYYDRDALSQLDEDYVYAGFFAARNAEATFSDISLTLTDPATDAPAEAKPIKYVTPHYTVTSATATGNAEYLFRFVSTADGWLTIGGRDVEDEYVKANVEYTKKYTLTEGDNNFVITFTPDPNFVPLKGDKLTSYEPYRFTHTVKFKTYGQAKESIWVAPDGSPQGTGEESLPLDIYTAFKYAQPGQQIILKGGKYNLYSTVTTGRGNNGTADAYITVIADPNADERPVLDFNWSCAGMILAGDYWYFKGFDVTHSADALKGVQVSGSHNVLDQINTYHNGNTGIQISRYLSSDTWDNWPSYNLILNCTSYGNADKGYEDADGFAAKLTVADGNVFDGCISYNNADDGWDLFAKVETGSIGSVTLQNCVAYGNGYLEDGTDAGNGNGFKMGGDSLSGYHRLINSVAYNNKAKGIDSNSCPDIQVTSSTTFNNESYNVAFYTNTAANTDFGANGILSYRKDTNVAEQFKTKGTQDTSKIYGDKNYYWDTATKVSANKAGEAVDDSWFVTTDTSITPTRNADGTINMHGLLVLTDKAPEGVGARINGTPSAVIDKNDSVYYPTDSNEDVEDNTDAAITNPDVKGTINVIGQNIGAVVPAGTVIKNAAGATVTAGDVYVKAVPKAADDSTAASILEAAKNQGLKIADNAGVAYYDVELVDAAGNPLTFEGTITISFAYPDGTNADGFTFSVLHLLKSGTLDVIDPALNQAGLSVNVTEFSPFAVVYLQKAANGEAGQTIESAKTGDSTPIMPIVVILLASAAVICAGIVVSKKKRA